MPIYNFTGETIHQLFPAEVIEKELDGVIVSKIVGTDEMVKETTEIFSELYPLKHFKMEAFGDAIWLGEFPALEGGSVDIYELIVLRTKRRAAHGTK